MASSCCLWLQLWTVFILGCFNIVCDANNSTTPGTTPVPKEVILLENLMQTSSESFNVTLLAIAEEYGSVPVEDLELIYFNDLYVSDPSTRPTYKSSEETIRMMSVILDIFDMEIDSTVNITAREILCTATYIDDLAVFIFLGFDSGDLGTYDELTQIMMFIIEVSDCLIDERFYEQWRKIRKISPTITRLVETIDIASLTLANILESQSKIDIKSNVRNIDYWFTKDRWVNISSQDWLFETYGPDTISVTTQYFNQIGFDDSDIVAIVGAQFWGISELMGMSRIKDSVSDDILAKSALKTRVLSDHVLTVSLIKIPDMSGTLSPIDFNITHNAKAKSYMEATCVYWDPDLSPSNGGLWSNDGCMRILPEDEEILPDMFNSRCECNKTTSMKYTLLMLEHESTPYNWHYLYQTYIVGISGVLSSLPLFSLLWVLVYLDTMDRKRRLSQINFIFSFIMVGFIIGGSYFSEMNEWSCMGVGISMHLFTMSTFTWLFIISLILFTRLTDLTKREVHWGLCVFIGWGLPLCIVGIPAGLGYQKYGEGQRCWLNTNDATIMSAFQYPMYFFTVLSLLLLLISLRACVMASKMTLFEREKEELYKLKGTNICYLLIEVDIFITMYAATLSLTNTMIGYVFAILFALQGILIWVFERKVNKEIAVAWELKKNPPEPIESDDDDDWLYDEDGMLIEDLSDSDYEDEESRPGTARTQKSVLTTREIQMGRTGGDGESQGRNSANEKKRISSDNDNNYGTNSVEAQILAKLAATRLARQKIVLQREASEAQIKREASNLSRKRPPRRPKSRPSNDRRSADGGSFEGKPNTNKGGFSTIADAMNVKKSKLKPPSASSSKGKITPVSSPRLSLPGEIEDPEDFELPVTPSSRKSGDGSARLGNRQSPEGGEINKGYDGDYGDYDEDYDGEYGEDGEYYDEDYDENYDENYEGEYDENYDEEYGEYDEDYYEEDKV